MKTLLQIGIVFLICLIGEIISLILPFPFPGSVIAMILLFLLLLFGALKVEHIRGKVEFMQQNMAFFFIPAGVGIIEYFGVLQSTWLPFLLICVITTILTFAATALTVTLVMKLQRHFEKKKEETHDE